MKIPFRKLADDEVKENQEWAKEEFFRQQNAGGKAYFVNWLWHPAVRVHICKLITEEALQEMP